MVAQEEYGRGSARFEEILPDDKVTSQTPSEEQAESLQMLQTIVPILLNRRLFLTSDNHVGLGPKQCKKETSWYYLNSVGIRMYSVRNLVSINWLGPHMCQV
jgi:hypothetical protein